MREKQLNRMQLVNLLEGDAEEVVALLETLEPNECITRGYHVDTNTRNMQAYVDRLREAGLDIGKGEAKFGYKMPLPEKEDSQRKLVIFRR